MSGKITVTFRAPVSSEDQARALVANAASAASGAFDQSVASIRDLTLVTFEADPEPERTGRTIELTDAEERVVRETLRRLRQQ